MICKAKTSLQVFKSVFVQQSATYHQATIKYSNLKNEKQFDYVLFR